MTENESKKIRINLIGWVRGLFNLQAYKSREDEVIESIRNNVEFKGSNLWVLIFAILIASIGLNVNSGAVVIGAMLISPLMGPILGLGLGVGIYDFALIKKSAVNLGVAALISILTAGIYFLITPMKEAHSELLARTTPTTWDVLIAFFGGMAGIIATASKEKGNVIPGVAIATALIPPLCTAGYGLATGHWSYFFGAFYLFFINSVFICFSTILIVRYLRFPHYSFVDERLEKRVKNTVTVVVLATIIPSIFIAYTLVLRSIFENRSETFLKEEMLFDQTAIANKKFDYESKTIEVLLIGDEVDSSELNHIRKRMPAYKLEDTRLIVRQGTQKVEGNPEVGLTVLQSMLENTSEKLRRSEDELDHLREALEKEQTEEFPTRDILEEMKAQGYPAQRLSLGSSVFHRSDSSITDTVCVAIVVMEETVATEDKERIRNWLKARTKSDQIKVVWNQ